MDEPTQSSPDTTGVPEVDSTPLALNDDLFDVKSELTPVAANWKSIGIALRLKSDALDGIQAGSSGDLTACLTSMVTEWLKRNYNVNRFGEPTWKWLVGVVGDPAGGNNKELARNIARRHKAESGTNETDMGEIHRKRRTEGGTNMPETKKAKVGDSQQSSDGIPPHTPDSKSPNDTLEGQPATSTVDEECVKEIKKLATRSPLVLVTAGIPGAGKSTLINNLLGLKGKKAAKAKFSRKSVTKHVDYYEGEVHGITVRIIDTPGLEAKDLSSKEEKEELATLSVLTDGKADLLLYCMKLTDRSDDRDERIVMKLTKAFGKEMWRHTVLVLTFGDVALNKDGDRDLLEEFTEDFEEALKKAGVFDITVKSILSSQNIESDHEVQYPAIIGVPVGVSTDTPPNWISSLIKEIIKKCKFDAIPAILMLQGMPPEWVAKVLRQAGALFGSVGGAAVGGGVGSVAGSVVGMGIGAAVGVIFGGVGAAPGAAAGAVIGESIGTSAGMVFGSAGTAWCVDELTGLAKIIKARKRVEELKEKRNVKK